MWIRVLGGAAMMLAACMPWQASRAMIPVGGGIMCNVIYYYVDGSFQGVSYQDCMFVGGGGGGGGGSGGTSSEGNENINFVLFDDLETSDISDRLQCALNKYTKANARPKRQLKNTAGFAYVKTTSSKDEYRFTKTCVEPSSVGPGWHVVGGVTDLASNTPSYIFLYAYNAGLKRTGVYYVRPENELGNPSGSGYTYSDNFNSFEMPLFTAAHEVAHQNSNAILYKEHFEESWATWYGYAAVLEYRKDNGAKCPH